VRRTVLITGGAGFIGASYARRRLAAGDRVVVLDNLSRSGSERNLGWLRTDDRASALEVVIGDVRDRSLVAEAARDADAIVHLAAQVSVMASLRDPVEDFEVNAGGTLNVLEAARRSPRRPAVLYASTNKVYGDLARHPVTEDTTRHLLQGQAGGVSEDEPLDLRTPYACSKGAGDLYAQDAWASFGVPTVVLRQSCIYGPRQLGCEEQGWATWLIAAAVCGRAITIYGDGKQVRDLLWIDDLLDCYDRALERIDKVAGQVLNVGGGPDFSLSVWSELAPLLARHVERLPEVIFRPWRPSDQRVYVSDTRRAQQALGWRPRVAPAEGVERLVGWARRNIDLFERGDECESSPR